MRSSPTTRPNGIGFASGVDVDSALFDLPTLRFLLAALVGWLDRQQQSLLFIPHVCPDQV
jgi:hypothetical protein